MITENHVFGESSTFFGENFGQRNWRSLWEVFMGAWGLWE
jgi:hypothetical protein